MCSSDLVAKTAKPRLSTTRMQGKVDQREDGQHEEEKSSTADQNPEECARTSF